MDTQVTGSLYVVVPSNVIDIENLRLLCGQLCIPFHTSEPLPLNNPGGWKVSLPVE